MTNPTYASHIFRPWRGTGDTRIVANERAWKEPLKWEREAKEANTRPRVLIGPDLFEDWRGAVVNGKGEELYDDHKGGFTEAQFGYGDIPLPGQSSISMASVIRRAYSLIDATPHLDWLVSTEWPERIMEMTPAYFPGGYIAEAGLMNQEGPRPNLWPGARITTQAEANERIPHLLHVPAAVRWLDVRPKEEIQIVAKGLPPWWNGDLQPISRIDWVAIHDPAKLAYGIDLAWQCREAGVPVWWSDNYASFRDLPEARR